MGIGNFAYYNFQTDSLIYQELIDIEPVKHKTYAGLLNNQAYVDSLQALVNVLSQIKNGVLPDKFADSGGTYCGPEYYVEFTDEGGEHYYLFILDGNDTVDAFNRFFYRLPELSWKKESVSNHYVNQDKEIVAAMKKVGVYEQVESPYIPQPCSAGNTASHLFGTWREINFTAKNKVRDYYRVTLTKEGKWVRETLYDGKAEYRKEGKFVLSKDRKGITWEIEGHVYRYTILKLSDYCMEMKNDEDNSMIRYDRL